MPGARGLTGTHQIRDVDRESLLACVKTLKLKYLTYDNMEFQVWVYLRSSLPYVDKG